LNGNVYIIEDIVINNIGDNNMINIVDDSLKRVVSVLRVNSDGLTITEIVYKIKLGRSAVRTALAKLEGGDKVSVKKVGMAKLYSLKN
jgi:DNA-binding transcriptional regulator GbsR (MarR family)